jgi:hypothetical protein
MLKAPGSILIFMFHFFNELATEMKTMLVAFVSFFNELATEKQNYACSLCFIF